MRVGADYLRLQMLIALRGRQSVTRAFAQT
jgi:hypothetical protein